MDNAIIISIIILTVVSVIEIGGLFFCAALRKEHRPVVAVVPVLNGDTALSDTLDYYGSLLAGGSSCIDRLILIDYGADKEQCDICRSFCVSFDDAYFVTPPEFEENMKSGKNFGA